VSNAQTLHVLSAGAAAAVVLALAETLRDTLGVFPTFDAAGSIRARFIAGEPCDVLILPAAMQDALVADRLVEHGSVASLGRAATGIAVRDGEPLPPIADAAGLRASLAAATALYCPDTERATAGIHFVGVLRELGIHDRVAPKIHAFANGARAMAALAAGGSRGAIGCTQATEILCTPGVTLVGPLPAPFGLTTDYAAAVSAASAQPGHARDFVARLTGRDARKLREASGFLR
jgi:molybdate transport system substrate-binding protein